MTEEQKTRPKIKLLLLCAKPEKEDAETVLIAKNMAEACSNSVELVKERVTDVNQAVTAIFAHQPDIVHFYGSCLPEHKFEFVDDTGKCTDICKKSFLLAKLNKLPHEIKLAYFNGVVTDKEVNVTGGKIASFFCMQKKWNEDLSRRVVVPFYTALAFGNTLGFSFKKLWEALPDKDKHIMLRFRLDINPDKFLLRERPLGEVNTSPRVEN
ncbi:MAG TPA: hypothetical protein IAB06_07695 [Candidatus Avacidaminococcus intestinavium]|uniref:Uncharacterized protein n=1 Tax=Candidatus Avacidaminococcus intestinavium TaxID=2840684 RepID=A0A9D1SMB2_9FIRM|nr:hypothetical protein [Candidatus Avacidaminococcus intestinavium]